MKKPIHFEILPDIFMPGVIDGIIFPSDTRKNAINSSRAILDAHDHFHMVKSRLTSFV